MESLPFPIPFDSFRQKFHGLSYWNNCPSAPFHQECRYINSMMIESAWEEAGSNTGSFTTKMLKNFEVPERGWLDPWPSV